MKNRGMAVAAVAALCVLAGTVVWGQQAKKHSQKPDLGAMTSEVTKLRLGPNGNELAIWFPQEFFIMAGMQDGATREQAAKDMKLLDPYVVMVVQVSNEKEDGTSSYQNAKEVRDRTVLRLANNKDVAPLAKTPPSISTVVSAMKNSMAAEGDAGGANMHVLVFPAKVGGNTIVDASRKDKLTLVLKADKTHAESVFVWRTPFDALASSLTCPKCKEELSSKWSYCPWCGNKIAAPTTAPKAGTE